MINVNNTLPRWIREWLSPLNSLWTGCLIALCGVIRITSSNFHGSYFWSAIWMLRCRDSSFRTIAGNELTFMHSTGLNKVDVAIVSVSSKSPDSVGSVITVGIGNTPNVNIVTTSTVRLLASLWCSRNGNNVSDVVKEILFVSLFLIEKGFGT